MADRKSRQVINDLRGGRNGYDPPWAIAKNECADAVNIDWYKATLCRKRGGMEAATTTGMTLAGVVSSAFRHVPGTTETAQELWLTDDSATPIVNRLAGGTVWSAPTLKDAPTGNGWDFDYASINSKLGVAYLSAQPRFHYWDQTTLRRAGLMAPIVPTVADQGTGHAIAVDATATLNLGATTTFNHTCSASATILWVMTKSTSAVTGVTYNGVAMTQVDHATVGYDVQIFYLVSPSTGVNVISISGGGGTVGAASASYTNARITTVPDVASQKFSEVGATATETVTTSTDSCWALYAVTEFATGHAPTAGTNSVARAVPSAASAMGLFDSGAPITPPGAYTMSVGITAASNGVSIITAFAPASGFYQSILRYYRVRWTRQVAGITIGRSEPGTSLSFTPSGTGDSARITQPTVANEGETHWEVEASTDNTTFYRIATVAIGTTTYDDSATTTSYNSNPISALTGVYTLQKSYKYVAADQNRLLGFGSNTPTDKQSRLEFSAVIGSLDVGDEERVDTTTNYFLDFDENDSGTPTGLEGPILGSYIAFKQRQAAQLTPNGTTDQPYRQDFISKTVGATNNEAITRGEDASGNPALYWFSYDGPYRWGVRGLEYIGHNMEDYIVDDDDSVAILNQQAAKRVAVAVYYPAKRQVWFFWATGTSDDPNVGAIFDVKTGGWSRIPQGDLLASIRCATLFSTTIGVSMSRKLKPYVGQTGGTKRIYKCDTGNTDAGTLYQSFVVTRAEDPGGDGYDCEIGDMMLLGKAARGVTITDTVICDFDPNITSTGTADLTPEATETRVSARLEGAGISGKATIQHQLGDGLPVANSWTLDELVVPVTSRGATSQ